MFWISAQAFGLKFLSAPERSRMCSDCFALSSFGWFRNPVPAKFRDYRILNMYESGSLGFTLAMYLQSPPKPDSKQKGPIRTMKTARVWGTGMGDLRCRGFGLGFRVQG